MTRSGATEMAELCLPRRTRDLVKNVPVGIHHPGLQLDKLSAPGDQEQQKRALGQVVKTAGDDALLQRLRTRRREHLNTLGARTWRAETTGPLTLHLARAAALENAGLCLHPLYGFACLPGSGLKGMARAFAETLWLPTEADPVAAWDRIERVFGWAPETDKRKDYKPEGVPRHAEDDRSRAGAVVFHEAWPETWPRLLVDITNNHHPQYYQGDNNDAPGDWENPVPVYFLALAPGTSFSFALAPRAMAAEADELVDLAAEWLQGALCHSGAGAKTNAGYGAFRLLGVEQPAAPTSSARATWETTLELVTPAFLAGANQGAEDCDLRPATLRGLLRWWWRTLHAGFVDVETLRALEAAVWGDTEAGGAVRLTVERASPSAPVLLNGPRLQREHQLQRPADRRATQGLFYAYYGMEGTRDATRYYLLPGAAWIVQLAARPTRYPNDPKAKNPAIIPSDAVLGQAKAALWLLCHYGGVGSKSRKGFGSFGDIGGNSLDDCKREATRFRIACGLPVGELRSGQEVESPSLDYMLPFKDAQIGTANPWQALDRLGAALQTFNKSLRERQDRQALGLPRARVTKRHAAPMHFHFARIDRNSLVLRVAAFPSTRLPDYKKSSSILATLLEHLTETLAARPQPRAMPAPGERFAKNRWIVTPAGERAKTLEAVPSTATRMWVEFEGGDREEIPVAGCTSLD